MRIQWIYGQKQVETGLKTTLSNWAAQRDIKPWERQTDRQTDRERVIIRHARAEGQRLKWPATAKHEPHLRNYNWRFLVGGGGVSEKTIVDIKNQNQDLLLLKGPN